MKSVRSSAASKKGQRRSRSAEKLLRQEEERKRLEEEELRLAEEQLEREIIEQKRLEEEERMRIAAEDKVRKDNELPELLQILDRNMASVQKLHKNLREVTKWQRYMKCDGTPDPTNPQEINTFINLSRENPNTDINALLNCGRIILGLLDELQMLLSDTPPEELSKATAAQYLHTIWNLQDLLSNINDKVTDILLQKAIDLVDIETGNMQEVVNDENVTLCLWANFNKNPRFRGYDFVKNHVEFEIPRPLAMCDIAIRILHTQYDHISCHIPLFQAQQKAFRNDPILTEAEREMAAEEEKAAEEEENEAEAKEEEAEEKEPNEIQVQEGAKEETDNKEPQDVEPKPDEDSKPGIDEDGKFLLPTRTRSALSSSSKDELLRNRSPSGERSPTQGATNAELQGYQSKETLDESIVDFSQYTPLGGVYYFDVLKLPPQPKIVKGWRIVQPSETGLQPFSHPLESAKESISSLGTIEERDGEHPVQPVGITIKLPARALFFEQPTPARWDSSGVEWRTDGIHHIMFDAETEQLSFKMDTFSIFTLIQRNYVNMPFQSWYIKPVAENEALLTVYSALVIVEIRIKELCQLCPISIEDNLSHIRGKWMAASSLIICMINAGLNIFPGSESEKYITKTVKIQQLEQATYTQMALVASAFAFKSSKWNLNCEQEEIVLQAHENLAGEMVGEDSWSLYLLRSERSQDLSLKESDEEWTKEPNEGSEMYSNLYHMMRGRASDAALERILNADHLFFTSVNEILQATKVLSHTV
ncbi:dynein axonemal intermediate chain 7 isoform X2 [Rhinoraja longicauda]